MTRPLILLTALMLAGCASRGPGPVETTRFHLGAPIARGAVLVNAADPSQAASLESRNYAGAVAAELAAAGFAPVRTLQEAEYVATFAVAQTARIGAERRSGLSIGLGAGGGGYRGGGGVGVGVTVPVGEPRRDEVRLTTLSLDLKRKSDTSLIWEGRASAEAAGDRPEASPGVAVPRLAKALLAGFPGTSGTTVRVK